MSCSQSCQSPTPAQAHCGACHITFGGVRAFDAHRKGGSCADPVLLGMQVNTFRAWSWPISEEKRAQLAAIRSGSVS